MRCLILLSLLTLTMTSCGTPGVLDQGEDLSLRPLVIRVLDRHDNLATSILSGSSLDAALADSAIFRSAFDAREITVRPLYSLIMRTLSRHDELTMSPQAGLSENEGKLARMSTANIRRTVWEAYHGAGKAEQPNLPEPPPPPPEPDGKQQSSG